MAENDLIFQKIHRSTGALWVFVLFVVPAPLCLLLYHFVLWTTEQSAIMSLSTKKLVWAGPIGLATQGLLMTTITVALWYFTKDDRFKPVYANFFIASLVAFPGLLLRTLGPNNDQLGSIIQFMIALIAALTVIWFRKEKIFWDLKSLPLGLIVAGIGVIPFTVYGSFGSGSDVFFSLLASLSFGLFGAVLINMTTENRFLNGAGIGTLLALLASSFGYDGSQLILLAILPPFAFAISTVLPSKAATWAVLSVLTFAVMAMFDSTELTFVLGDIGNIALKTSALVFGIGLMAGLIALILCFVPAPVRIERGVSYIIGWTGVGVVWVSVVAIFFIFGNPGSYGDRLFVIMKDQLDISEVANIKEHDKRLITSYKKLTAHANATQMDLRDFFDKAGVEYTPYYLENAMEVHGGALIRLYLLTRPEVDRVLPSPRLRAVPDDLPSPGYLTQVEDEVQWNISMIGADKVWSEFNVRGAGIVVGQSDSGVDGNHPAIQKQYRGYNTEDDYNWFDPWDGTSSPNDEGGHGTHTTGIILGSNGIGVAPEARWIGCVNLDRNLANPALYLDCMQFMLAPFPQGGDPLTDGDPTQAAHVVNNSWGCPTIEGCDPNAMLHATDNLRNAGIFVVVSTGNDGPNCQTVETPLSLYDSAFSVGAINQFGDMADFSSRGPVTADGSGRTKPDIVAPGVEVLSSLPQGTYGANSGTSMAGPHVVGVVALIWSARPDLIGNIEATEQLINETAQPYTGDTSVGCFSDETPSYTYGYGVVDVYAAVKEALGR